MCVKVAVIGSNSFSGASFSDFALQQGVQVLGMSRSAEPHVAFLPYRWSGKDTAFRFFPYDLNKHLNEIIGLLDKEQPPYILNFAAQSMVGESWKYPEHWFHTNVVSTVKLHDQLRQRDYLKKYVHFSTPEVYGSTDGFISEDASFRPSTPYAVSRAAADMSLRTFFEAYKFPVVFTRAANVYGPGQPLYRIIPRTLLFFRIGQKLSLHGGGHSRRSFIHVRDVADATWRVMTSGAVGETYHISTNHIVSVRELVEQICIKLNIDFLQNVEIVGERLGNDTAYMLDSSKIRRELGWSDSISLSDGLDGCVTWVDRYLPDLQQQSFDYIHKA